MTLFRPVGLAEMRLIYDSQMTKFPPRLAIQPIFYPVLNFDYAAHIAREWNIKDPVSGFVGFMTRFEIPDEYAAQFPVQVVGARVHEELWIPAEELENFNAQIVGEIEVVAHFVGEKFEGEIDPQTHLPQDW